MQTFTDETVVCVGCGKHPSELPEYVDMSEQEPEYFPTAVHAVVKEEGTFNPENGHFLCTPCYIRAGQPSSPYGWRAP